MKHLLGGVAIAALITAGLPAWAQNSNVGQSKQAPQAETQSGMPSRGAAATDNPQGGATSDMTTKPGRQSGTSRSLKSQRGGTTAGDNMAEELNRQELQRVQNSGGTTGSGQTQAPGADQSGAMGTSPGGATGGSR